MGAFLLITNKNDDFNKFDEKASDSIDVFKQKRLLLSKSYIKPGFRLYVFNKQKIDVSNHIEYDQNNFIVGTGTFIYKETKGGTALNKIFHEFDSETSFFTNLRGDFAIIIFKNGKLLIFNSIEGLYHIYKSADNSLLSNSIIPLVSLQKELNISKQEFFEYVLTGASYGDKTVFHGIDQLDSTCIYQLMPDFEIYKKPEAIQLYDFKSSNIDKIITEVSDVLAKYFGMIGSVFNNNIVTPLTGGFDTRLIFALLKAVKLRPDHAFVLKKDNLPDIEIAQMIAKSEDIELKVLSNDFPDFRKDSSMEILKNQFYLYDGLGIGGIFQFFSGLDVWAQLDYKLLLLDGGGGEIYRNIHYLPDRNFTLKRYVEKVLHKKDHSLFTDQYNNDEYLEKLTSKVRNFIFLNEAKISRGKLEMIYPLFYQKYWMGQINSLANQFSYYLTPFSDSKIVMQSNEIPVEYKNKGYFESLLIKKADQSISKFPSNYGFNFYDFQKPKRNDIKKVTSFFPDDVKKMLKRIKKRINKKNNLPFYSQSDYVREALKMDNYVKTILGVNNLEVSDYIDFKRATEPAMVSRALSVELLKSKIF